MEINVLSMNIKTEITKLHYDKNAKGVFLLDFASVFYGFASNLKNRLYDKKILKPERVDAYVICVGNITTGGVGKTPVVSQIANYFASKGEKTAIISRGYGGKLSNKNINVISDGKSVFYNARLAGDEPYWLAENTKGVFVITSKNRYKAAKYAVEKYGVTKIILDDGFQHRKLYRDLDVVLMDSKMGFGNEKLLPAGPLREGMEAFARIDRLVVVSKDTDHKRAEKLAKIMGKKMKVKTSVCCTEPDYVYNIKTGERLADGAEITAFCAIGQPKQFYDFLSNYKIKATKDFDDHHSYTEDEIPSGIVVTTEKDAVKMIEFKRDNIYALKLKTVIDVEELITMDSHL
ncbi:tetraacyldisaccharide 4'-kinase [Clostridium sp. CAG:967]|nr:tetraacyldisaccharide 4'-kinase [Clostridium sp. CAG:967]